MMGNNYGMKLKDAALRKRAYVSLCEWIAKGKSIYSFTFEEGEFQCVYNTLDSYIKKYPDEFEAIKREFAKSKGYAVWEQVVEDSAIGKNKEANTASLQMLMRNKFDWDKKDPQAEFNPEALQAYAAFFAAIPALKPKSVLKAKLFDIDLAHQENDCDE